MTASDPLYSTLIILIFEFFSSIMVKIRDENRVVEMFDREDFVLFLEIKRGIAKSTITTRVSRLLRFIQYVKSHNLTVEKLTIEKFIYSLKQEGYKSSAINTYIVALRTYALYCRDRGLPSGFMEGFRSLPEQETNKRTLSPGEVEQLLQVHFHYKSFANDRITNFLDSLYYCITKFLLYTGCRISEAQDLTYERLDLSQGIAMVGKKNYKLRNIFLPADLVIDIRNLLGTKSMLQDDLVFAGRNGYKFNYPDYYNDLKRRMRAANIYKPEEISPHNLRHTFGSDLAANDVDLAKIGTLLGHKDIRVTYKTYVHYQQNHLRNAALRLSVLQKYQTEQEKALRLIDIVGKQGFPQATIIKEKDAFYVKVKIG